MQHKVYFSIFGKNMKTTIEANNPDQAKQAILDKIIFHKIEPEYDSDVQNLMDLLGMM